jgi:hypothetical protein
MRSSRRRRKLELQEKEDLTNIESLPSFMSQFRSAFEKIIKIKIKIGCLKT